jgi:predicted MPP superfamily phosphohydrolase
VVEALNIPLTLSGHTHAGQFKVFGYPISSLMFNESEGWYHEGNQSLYINTGIGCTLPVRIGVPAEITLITLRAN